MDDRWLSMKEICAYLGVSHDTISRWIANYNMPSMKMGKCWKFKKDQIEDWLAKGGPEKSRKKLTKRNRVDVRCLGSDDILRIYNHTQGDKT